MSSVGGATVRPVTAVGLGGIGVPLVAAALRDAADAAEGAAVAIGVAIPAGWSGSAAEAYRASCGALAMRLTMLSRRADLAAAAAHLHEVEMRERREALAAGAAMPV